jgi:hypothetical protein
MTSVRVRTRHPLPPSLTYAQHGSTCTSTSRSTSLSAPSCSVLLSNAYTPTGPTDHARPLLEDLLRAREHWGRRVPREPAPHLGERRALRAGAARGPGCPPSPRRECVSGVPSVVADAADARAQSASASCATPSRRSSTRSASRSRSCSSAARGCSSARAGPARSRASRSAASSGTARSTSAPARYAGCGRCARPSRVLRRRPDAEDALPA